MNRRAIIAVALGLAAGFAHAAHARSTLKVVNKWNQRVTIEVYNGKDRTCQSRNASHTEVLSAGGSAEFHCEGQSADRCRVTVLDKDAKIRYCTEIYKDCSKRARDVEDGGAITLSGKDSAPKCSVTGKDGSTKAEGGGR